MSIRRKSRQSGRERGALELLCASRGRSKWRPEADAHQGSGAAPREQGRKVFVVAGHDRGQRRGGQRRASESSALRCVRSEVLLIPSPGTGEPGSLTPARAFNLMFETQVGPYADAASKSRAPRHNRKEREEDWRTAIPTPNSCIQAVETSLSKTSVCEDKSGGGVLSVLYTCLNDGLGLAALPARRTLSEQSQFLLCHCFTMYVLNFGPKASESI